MNFEDNYIENLIQINKNLRDQLDYTYKLLRTKLKIDENSRLENILNELEILKTSLSFKNLKNLEQNFTHKYHEDLNNICIKKDEKISELENIIDTYSKENMLLQERIHSTCSYVETNKIELQNNLNLLEKTEVENVHLLKQIDEEKNKNKNLVSLIKELEKKKSSVKLENEIIILKEQVEFLNSKLKEYESINLKYKSKLEKKSLIIKKLDESLLEYEYKLNLKNKN